MPQDRPTLTDEQNEELEAMFNVISDHTSDLNDWEKGFIQDNYNRWQQYGKNIYVSEKQWATIIKIYNKVSEEK